MQLFAVIWEDVSHLASEPLDQIARNGYRYKKVTFGT